MCISIRIQATLSNIEEQERRLHTPIRSPIYSNDIRETVSELFFQHASYCSRRRSSVMCSPKGSSMPSTQSSGGLNVQKGTSDRSGLPLVRRSEGRQLARMELLWETYCLHVRRCRAAFRPHRSKRTSNGNSSRPVSFSKTESSAVADNWSTRTCHNENERFHRSLFRQKCT